MGIDFPEEPSVFTVRVECRRCIVYASHIEPLGQIESSQGEED